MATAPYTEQVDVRDTSNVSVTRLLVSGGFTAAIVFVLCWLGTFAPFSNPTHAYISLFTAADISSLRALCEGMLWSILFGGLVSGVFALVYNATARLGRR